MQTLMTRYRHFFKLTANRIFDDLDENCRTIVVNAADRFTKPRAQKTRKPLRHAGFPMWR